MAAQAAPAGMVVPGQFGVGSTGASSYGVPISVPPGTSGLGPELSLSYSSQSGDGLAGLGWSLSGLSAVTRCPRTIAQDGIHGSVNYDANDRFCMNGQRLILISGTYGADGSQYRTEIESFSKIIAHGSAGSGPAWFEVHTKAGLTLEFGNTTDSRVLVVDATTGVTPTARLWAVDKVSDTAGNYFTATYNCIAVAGACTDVSRTTYGQSYPLRIDYTGNSKAGVTPYNSLQFTYTSRGDSFPTYQAGAMVQATVLLSEIRAFQAANLVSDYKLGYRAGSATLRSRLTSITLCDGGSPQSCLVPTTFGWQGGSGSLAMTSSAPINAAQGGQVLPGDFNGDGLLDMVTVNPNKCSPYNVYFGTPSTGLSPSVGTTLSAPADGAPSCTVTAAALALTGPNSTPYLLLPITAHRTGGDENDGMLISSHAGNFQNQSFPFTTSTAPKYPGDYNGDGLIDFLLQKSPTSYAYLGNGSGGFTADGGHTGLDPSNTVIAAADFDGDGCTDILALPAGAGGGNAVTYLCQPATASATPPSTAGYNITLGDFNGDGKTDMLLTSTSGAGKLYFSTGTGFVLSSCAVPSGWGNYRISVGNWDGDGKADLLLVQPASGGTPGSSQLWVSTGTCFTQALDANNNPITIATQTATPNALVADWNNDGASDIWMQENFNNGSATPANDRLYTFNYVPELMTSVSNGIGATTTVSYDRLNKNGTFYKIGSSASFPTIDVDGALYVVSRVDLSNGLGTCTPAANFANCYSSTYAYAGAQTHLQGRGFLGFAQIAITDLQTHIVQTTNYGQAFPYTGLVTSKTTRYIGNVNTLSSVTNTPANNGGCGVTPSSGLYFVCNTQTVTAGYDLNDSAAFPTTTTSYSYDSFGNALTVNVSVSDGSSRATTNTYSNDTTNWFLGRLLTTAVQSIVGSSNITRHSAFAYDAATGLLTQETVEPGISTCNAGSDPCTITTAYGYDVFGHRISSQVSGANIATRTSYAGYDAAGQFQVIGINALGQRETWLHDPRFGGATSHTGPNGLTTLWAYDGFGRMTGETRPDGTRTTANYNYCAGLCAANGAITSQSQSWAPDGTTHIGAQSTDIFDMLSRPVANDSQGFNGNTVRVSTVYNANGQVVQKSRPYFTATGTPKYSTFSYDALGRVTQAVAPNAATTTNLYDGLVSSITNALGQTSTATLNAQGHTASVQDAAGKTTAYVYDAFGNLLTVTDPAGNVLSASYDIRGNKVRMSDPDAGIWTYAYDVGAELTSQTDAKSQVTSLSYDLLGRPTSRTEPGFYSSWTYGTSPGFRNVGQLIDAKSCTASSCASMIADRSFTYDSLGRPATTILQTGANSYSYLKTYNPTNGALASVTYPSGFVLGYGYNAFGYICATAEYAGSFGCAGMGNAHIVAAVNSRDAENHPTQSTAGNGVVTSQTYDLNTGLIASLRAGTGGAVASFDYTFDAIGNLTARTDRNENYTEGFCYDVMNRLTTYSHDAIGTASWGSQNWGFVWGAPCGRVSTSNWGAVNWGGFPWGATCGAMNCKTVLYDATGIGNITQKSDAGSYSYPAAGSARPHAVLSVTGSVDGISNPLYAYDGNGNMTCMSTGAGCTGTIGRQVTLTAFNMADTITKGVTAIGFAYDSEHQRVRQTNTVSGSATTTTYFEDPASGASAQAVVVGSGAPSWVDYIKLDGQIVAQRSASYASPVWGSSNWGGFAWGVSLTGSNWGANNWGSFGWAGPASASWVYFNLDHLGSVAVTSDASGAVTQRLSYDAWGKQRNPDGSDAACGTITAPTTRGFTNQEQVPLSCMVNLNARVYDPLLGKFMAPDSKVPDPANGQAFNRYAYVLNNPLSFTDPTGHDTFCSCIDPGDGIFSSSSYITGGGGGGGGVSVSESAIWKYEIPLLDSGNSLSGFGYLNGGTSPYGTGTAGLGYDNSNTGSDNSSPSPSSDASGTGTITGTNSAPQTPDQADKPAVSTTTTVQGDVAANSSVVQVGLGDVTASDTLPAPAVESTSVTAAKFNLSTQADTTALANTTGAIGGDCPGCYQVAAAGIGHNGGPPLLPWIDRLLSAIPGLSAVLALDSLTNPTPADLQVLNAYDNLRQLVKPGGNYIGSPGNNSGIRQLPGGQQAAQQLFDKLKVGGTDITPAGYPGQLYRLPADIGTVGFRPVSTSGPPTIDINTDALVQKLKF